jgi:hypothetical protein
MKPGREAQAMKWQSIDAAPKDGTPVLLYFRETSMRIGCWKDRGPYGTGWRDPVGHAEQATILGEPTHWMALPDPPARREPKAARATNRKPASGARLAAE